MGLTGKEIRECWNKIKQDPKNAKATFQALVDKHPDDFICAVSDEKGDRIVEKK